MVRLTVEIEVEDMAEGLDILNAVTNAVGTTSITGIEIEALGRTTVTWTAPYDYSPSPTIGADNT